MTTRSRKWSRVRILLQADARSVAGSAACRSDGWCNVSVDEQRKGRCKGDTRCQAARNYAHHAPSSRPASPWSLGGRALGPIQLALLVAFPHRDDAIPGLPHCMRHKPHAIIAWLLHRTRLPRLRHRHTVVVGLGVAGTAATKHHANGNFIRYSFGQIRGSQGVEHLPFAAPSASPTGVPMHHTQPE